MLVRLGIILPSSELHSEDPEAQERIDRILTNRSLLEIAEKNPKTAEELKTVRGMGEKKCADYGTEILGVSSRPVWIRASGSLPSTSVRNP